MLSRVMTAEPGSRSGVLRAEVEGARRATGKADAAEKVSEAGDAGREVVTGEAGQANVAAGEAGDPKDASHQSLVPCCQARRCRPK